MCDRLPVISESSSSSSRISTGRYDSSAMLEEKTSSCFNCSLNRQSRAAMVTNCSFQMNTLSLERTSTSLDTLDGAAATTTTEQRDSQRRRTSSEATANKVIKNVKNDQNNRWRKFSDNSVKQSLLRLGAQTWSILTNPNLIIVIIVVLSNCPSTVKAKPLGDSSSRQGTGMARADRNQMNNIGKETVKTLEVAFNLMKHHLPIYLDKVWSKDMESFENEWGHVMEEFDWMGPTKNEDDYQNLEENEYLKELLELYKRFKAIKHGIQMIMDHTERGVQQGNLANTHMKLVLRSLEEYNQALIANGYQIKNFVAEDVDQSVIPDRSPTQETALIHHYKILKEFFNHLRFSNEMVRRLREKVEADQ